MNADWARIVHEKHLLLGIAKADCRLCWEREDRRPEWVKRLAVNAKDFTQQGRTA